jgi:imidazolonepropionase-like amidohydrolase
VIERAWNADLIAVDGDPVADINLLADPVHVTHVWKGGRLVKEPTASGPG